MPKGVYVCGSVGNDVARYWYVFGAFGEVVFSIVYRCKGVGRADAELDVLRV